MPQMGFRVCRHQKPTQIHRFRACRRGLAGTKKGFLACRHLKNNKNEDLGFELLHKLVVGGQEKLYASTKTESKQYVGHSPDLKPSLSKNYKINLKN